MPERSAQRVEADLQKRRNALVKIAFGIGALSCLAVGLAVYLMADRLGLDDSTATTLAIAFLVAGVADYLMLTFWDRIMARRQCPPDR